MAPDHSDRLDRSQQSESAKWKTQVDVGLGWLSHHRCTFLSESRPKMRQILKPINSGSCTRPQVNSSIKASPCSKNIGKVSVSCTATESNLVLCCQCQSSGDTRVRCTAETTTATTGTCHGTNSRPLNQKENCCSSACCCPELNSKHQRQWPPLNSECQSKMSTDKLTSKFKIIDTAKSDRSTGSQSSGHTNRDCASVSAQCSLPSSFLRVMCCVFSAIKVITVTTEFVHQIAFNYRPSSPRPTSRHRPPSPSTLRPKEQSSPGAITPDMALYGVVCLVVGICFANSLYGDFVHDDIPALVQNPDVLGTTTLSELFTHDFWGKPMSDPESHKSYRPITTLTFRLNMLFSVHTFGFHFVNLILHTVVSVLVCRFVRQVLHFDNRLALIAATLFATHPIHCEAVSSIVGRADVLCALFYLLALFAFHKSVQPSTPIRDQIVSLAECVLWSGLALLSKETGLTVFGVCALYWFAVRLLPAIAFSPSGHQMARPNVVALFLPIVTVTTSFAILLTLRLKILGGTLPFFSEQDNPASYSKSPLTRLLTYLYLAVFNLRLMISPEHQAYDWQTGSIHLVNSLTDTRNMTTVCLVFGLLVVFYRLVRSHLVTVHRTAKQFSPTSSPTKIASFVQAESSSYSSSHTLLVSVLLLVLPYMPASNLFLTVGFVVAERLLYIPSIGFVCLICAGIKRLEQASRHRSIWQNCLVRTSRLCQLMLACLAVIFALKTLQQNQVWNSRESLYKSGIVNVPENAKAHYNYANLQQDIGNLNDAMSHYQTAIRLWPQHASAHNNLGALFWRISQPDHAERHFSEALQINPYHAKAHFNLGKVYSKRGQTWEAIILMERSIRLDKRFGESYEALATLYAQLGQVAIAERLHLRAIRLRPRNADFHNNYGAFLQKTGRLQYALRQYYRALELKPNHRIALLNVANALTVLHRYEQAEHFHKRALRLKEDPVTLDSLGALFLRQSKLHLARHVYEYIWAKYCTDQPNDKKATKQKKCQHRQGIHQQMPVPSAELVATANIHIHYAQLLILEGRYGDAEVLLEALTRLEHDDDDQQQRWPMSHSIEPLKARTMETQANSLHSQQQPRQEPNGKSWHHHRQQSEPITAATEQNNVKTNKSSHYHTVHYRVQSGWMRQRAGNDHRVGDYSNTGNNANQQLGATLTAGTNQADQKASVWPTAKSANNPFDTSANKRFKYRLGESDSSSDGQLDSNLLLRVQTKSTRRSPSSSSGEASGIRRESDPLGSGQLMANQAILLLIDVHHQLALLYTLTNRTAEALDSISKALILCSSSVAASSGITSTSKSASASMANQKNRCAQIYTLQGDIRKDLHQWPDAIKSYQQAIQLDECLGRPHLNLAVIFHLEERYTEAMLHYTYAQQLDSGMHSGLISENMSKLRRQQITLYRHQRQSSSAEHKSRDNLSTSSTQHKTCQSRVQQSTAPPPNTTFDQVKRSSSFISDSDTATFRLLSVHASQILSSL